MHTPLLPLQLLHTCSLGELQAFNDRVYGEVNARNFFDLYDMASRLSRYNARVSLRVRKEETERTPYHLTMMLSWLFAISNRLGIDLRAEVASYCKTALSVYFADPKMSVNAPPVRSQGLQDNAPLSDLQTRFTELHGNTTLEKSALCLAEKVQGIFSALGYYRETHLAEHFDDVRRRLAQTVEALCVVASFLQVDLAEEFEKCFSNGCSTCHHAPCECGYRADKVV